MYINNSFIEQKRKQEIVRNVCVKYLKSYQYLFVTKCVEEKLLLIDAVNIPV